MVENVHCACVRYVYGHSRDTPTDRSALSPSLSDGFLPSPPCQWFVVQLLLVLADNELIFLCVVRSWLIFKHRSFAARATKPPDAVLRRPKKPMYCSISLRLIHSDIFMYFRGAFQLYFQEMYRDVSGRYPGQL
jgi:hypothetical protein